VEQATFGEGKTSEMSNIRQHPIATFFFIFFKAAALLLYLFCSLFTNSFVIILVIDILLLAFDLWTVQKISGRLIVGLRWWSQLREDGTTEWHFESVSDRARISRTDTLFFWIVLFATPTIWGFLVFIAILKLNFGWSEFV